MLRSILGHLGSRLKPHIKNASLLLREAEAIIRSMIALVCNWLTMYEPKCIHALICFGVRKRPEFTAPGPRRFLGGHIFVCKIHLHICLEKHQNLSAGGSTIFINYRECNIFLWLYHLAPKDSKKNGGKSPPPLRSVFKIFDPPRPSPEMQKKIDMSKIP